jgi:1-acyl-sn-glycerol-3-phosphate acyltransferase
MHRAPVPQRDNSMKRLLHGLFGIWALLAFTLCVLLALIATIFVPGLDRRRGAVAAASRWSFLLSGIRPEIRGLDNLPETSCVVVANHASYVDGILLKGFLPARFSFVIKGEMRNVPIAHFMMRRSGARFVERFRSSESSRDARQIVKAARGGESLGFFPEGTFLEEPGVGRFRAGAFMAAIKGQMPVVPVAIFGTRELLGSGQVLPRPVSIRVEILAPIAPDDPAFTDHHTLAEAARQSILAVHDEPDLLAA